MLLVLRGASAVLIRLDARAYAAFRAPEQKADLVGDRPKEDGDDDGAPELGDAEEEGEHPVLAHLHLQNFLPPRPKILSYVAFHQIFN